ncbi:hypothetical protein GTW43_11975 [Streptomyces sp. SID5785]|nr:hypothetical protein [Streptomyces sp. SID5785]
MPELGQVIARRELTSTAADGSTHPVVLEVGMPVQVPAEGGDWYCPCRISGRAGSVERVTAIWGVDSWQALLLALSLFPAELGYGRAPELSWNGGADLALWPDPARYGDDQSDEGGRQQTEARPD